MVSVLVMLTIANISTYRKYSVLISVALQLEYLLESVVLLVVSTCVTIVTVLSHDHNLL